jgi:CRP/FNR family transcriptional regulator, cyclic AMP receptor protein
MDFSGGWPFEPAGSGARVSEKEWRQRQAALAVAPLFAGLSRRHLRALTKVTTVGAYGQGEQVVAEGSGGSMFFVILDGRAKVVRGGRTITHFSPGDFFGEISVLDGGPRSASVVAETPLRCLRLGGKEFTEIATKEPQLAIGVLQEMAARLRRSNRSPTS